VFNPTADVVGVIDLDVTGPTINRDVYGHFAEHLGACIYGGFFVGEDSDLPNEAGIRLDVVQALRELRIPNLRWPGGCFADEYHWSNGIGPREQRPRMVNTHWGDVEEDNHFGTHEFMRLCELLDAEPYVSGNVGSGTVQEMSDWVEYLTRRGDSPMAALRRENGRDEPWRVKYWGLGNEAWGCGGNMTASQFAELARQFGTYCRDHDGNTLYRVAAGANSDDYGWTERLMQQLTTLGGEGGLKSFYQAVSLHHYTMLGTWERKGSATEFTREEYLRTMVGAQRMETLVAGHSAVMDAYDPDRTVGLVVDEWGTWWDVEPGTNPGFLLQQNTLRDALVAAVHLDTFHRHADRVVMANLAQTVNVLQAVLLTDGARLVRTPTFHVFEMNKDHQGAASLAVHLLAHPEDLTVGDEQLRTISSTASRRDGAVLVSLTNLHAEDDVEVELQLRGGAVGDPTARLLTSAGLADHNTGEAPDEVAVQPHRASVTDGTLRVVVPAHSFVTVDLPLV
jgi:alpha-N-arabinofuranosidase